MNPARFISKPLLTIATLIGGQTAPYIAPEMGVGSGSAETKDAAKAAMRSRWDMWLTWALAQGGDVAWHG